MKKRIALLLCLLMVVSLLFGCNQNTDTPTEATGGNGLDAYQTNPDTGLLDFDGKTVTYVSTKDGMGYINPEDAARGSKWEQAIAEHVTKIQELLNFEFDFQEEESLNLVKRLQAAAMAGSSDTDIVFAGGEDLLKMYPLNIFADINDLEYIDLSNTEKYGTAKMLEFAKYGDGIYSLYGIGNVTWPETVPLSLFNAIFINDDLLDTFDGVAHPLELHEKKTWNFSTFKSYLSQVSSPDVNNHIYGMTVWVGSVILARAALYANGAPVVATNSNGDYTFGYATTAAQNALEWASDIYKMKDQVKYPLKEASAAAEEEDVFETGKATMFLGHSFYGLSSGYFRQKLSNVSFIFFPYGPDVEYGSISTSYYDTPLATSFLRTGDEQAIGYIMNQLLEPMSNSDDYMDYIRDYYFPDYNDSYDLFVNETQNATYLYSSQLKNVSGDIDTAIVDVTEGRKTVTEAIDSIKDRVNSEIATQFQ